MDTVLAPTDTNTYEGRHRSREPGRMAVGSAMYEARHPTRPQHLADCVCRWCTSRPDIEAVLARYQGKTAGGAR